jgi:hypothetical protein
MLKSTTCPARWNEFNFAEQAPKEEVEMVNVRPMSETPGMERSFT